MLCLELIVVLQDAAWTLALPWAMICIWYAGVLENNAAADIAVGLCAWRWLGVLREAARASVLPWVVLGSLAC